MKPLGKPAYGSIPHLPGSRTGEGDYHIGEGQARIATEKKRDKNDYIIVQEKLDGSNVSVAKINGGIIALTRSGYTAKSSKYEQHHLFDAYVFLNRKRFLGLLNEGERVCGEWLAQAHGTRYDLPHEPFVPFDLITGNDRLIFDYFSKKVWQFDFTTPKIISTDIPVSITDAMTAVMNSGHGAIDPVEGAIWRVERHGKVDFLCKYVRHNKVDGKYFPERNEGKITWNI